jgi:hypothetical protein
MTTTPSDGPFPASELDANSNGRLTDLERRYLKGRANAIRKNEFVGAVMAAIVGVILLTATGPAPNAWLRSIVGTGLLVGAAFFLYRAATGDSLTQDLRSGRVEMVEGALGKRTSSGRTTSFYYFDVGHRHFTVSGAQYHAAPEAGFVRLFFLPAATGS